LVLFYRIFVLNYWKYIYPKFQEFFSFGSLGGIKFWEMDFQETLVALIILFFFECKAKPSGGLTCVPCMWRQPSRIFCKSLVNKTVVMVCMFVCDFPGKCMNVCVWVTPLFSSCPHFIPPRRRAPISWVYMPHS